MFFTYMHTDVIQSLLADKTEKKIRDIKKKRKNLVHSEIDTLPIADMLKHINYEQADEIRVLLNTLGMVMRQSRESIRGTSLENTLFVTWVNHIILHSGISNESEKERTLNLLGELWKQVTSGCKSEECRTFSVQLLIPFVDFGSADAVDMLV